MRNYADLLSTNVKQLMLRHGGTQKEFSSFVGVQQPVISRILAGQMKNPTLDTLASIAIPCKVTVQWLLTDHTQEPLKISTEDALEIIKHQLALAERGRRPWRATEPTTSLDKRVSDSGLSPAKARFIEIVKHMSEQEVADLLYCWQKIADVMNAHKSDGKSL